MYIIAESFEEQWAHVAAMTENSPFITGRPVIHTSGSMSTVKEGFFMRYGISFILILFGLAALAPMMPSLGHESDNGNFVIFLLLLLAVLFLYTGIVRILTVRRICWNEDAANIYLYYGWMWNRHIFQIPRESVHIKMSVAGQKRWSSYFYHGDTVLLLELKNRNTASPIYLLVNSSRDLINPIAAQLSATHNQVEDSTLAQESASDGRIIRFPKTGISRNGEFPTLQLSWRKRHGQIIFVRTLYQMAFWTAFIVLGGVGLVATAKLIPTDWRAGFLSLGFLLMLIAGIMGWFPGFGRTKVVVDSEKASVIIHQGFFSTGRGERIVSFGQIIGIQVCPRHVPGGESSGDYSVFELNLVVRSTPDVERINLLAGEDDERIISYAQQVAAAMNKLIFDHSMIMKKTLADTIIL